MFLRALEVVFFKHLMLQGHIWCVLLDFDHKAIQGLFSLYLSFIVYPMLITNSLSIFTFSQYIFLLKLDLCLIFVNGSSAVDT